MNIYSMNRTHSRYPELLSEIASPPKQLDILGDMPDKNMPLVAIVGSRKPTPYGRTMTESLSTECAHAGIGIISGLALGIDAITHRSVLDTGGYTLAVMACGLDRLYPATNRQLAIRMLKNNGTIITDNTSPPQPRSKEEEQVLALIDGDIHDGDEMLALLEWSVSDFQQTITLMEISGSIRRIEGNKWMRM